LILVALSCDIITEIHIPDNPFTYQSPVLWICYKFTGRFCFDVVGQAASDYVS